MKKTIKVKNIVNARYDKDLSECYNTCLNIVPKNNRDDFINFIITLFETKQTILTLEGN
jgi:hypothetical protein